MKLTIEIICLDCMKCQNLKKRIEQALKIINIAHTEVEFIHATDLKKLSPFSIGASQTPALLLNGKLEFAGGILPSPEQISKRITDIRMSGDII